MADQFTAKKRSEIMRAVRSSDTKPEMVVRRLVHSLGYRYRLHRRSLPGTPDLVFPRLRKVIFVHGCFWHRHSCRNGRSMPSSRASYWQSKLERNKIRDRKNRQALRRAKWEVLVLWECQLRNHEKLEARVIQFLASPSRFQPRKRARA